MRACRVSTLLAGLRVCGSAARTAFASAGGVAACSNASNGCEWSAFKVDVSVHTSSCQYAKVECPHSSAGCEKVVQQYQLYSHLQEECKFCPCLSAKRGCEFFFGFLGFGFRV